MKTGTNELADSGEQAAPMQPETATPAAPEQPTPAPRRSFMDKLTDVVGLTLKPTPQRTPRKASEESDAINDAVCPRRTKKVRLAAQAVPIVSDRQFFFISLVTGAFDIFPDEIFGQIDAWQGDYEDVMKVAMEHTPRKALEAHRAYLSECEKTAIESGQTGHATGKTAEDFIREFKHQFDVAIKASKTFAPRCRELVRPYIRQYVQRVRAVADEIAIEERLSYEDLGLEWTVSPRVATLYRAAEIIEQQLHIGAGHDPKSVSRFMPVRFQGGEHLTFKQPDKTPHEAALDDLLKKCRDDRVNSLDLK